MRSSCLSSVTFPNPKNKLSEGESDWRGNLRFCRPIPVQIIRQRTQLLVIASRRRSRSAKKQQTLLKTEQKIKDGKGSVAKSQTQGKSNVLRSAATAATKQIKPAEVGKVLADLANLQEEAESRTGKKAGRGRGARKAFAMDAAKTYTDQFTKALDLELSADMDAVRERASDWSNDRLEAEGWAVTGLNLSLEGYLYSDRVCTFYFRNRKNKIPPQNRFAPGDVLAITRGEKAVVEGSEVLLALVLERSSRLVRVTVTQDTAWRIQAGGGGGTGGRWRLDYAANTVGHERMTAALTVMGLPPIPGADSWKEPSMEADTVSGSEAAKPQWKKKEEEGPVDILLKSLLLSPLTRPQLVQAEAMARPQLGGSKAERQADRTATTGAVRALATSGRLNASQRQAVMAALNSTLTLWQGPPGTGKTWTIVNFVKVALTNGKVPRALVTADSNVAVDNLTAGLLSAGVRVVRVGKAASVRADLQHITLEALAATHPMGAKAMQLRKMAQDVQANNSSATNSASQESTQAGGTALWEEAARLQRLAERAVLKHARAVTATCIGSGGAALREWEFPLCVVDEACQATEPAVLVPLTKGVRSLLLVGDPCQLPATVISREAAELGLSTSLFERLQDAGVEPVMLSTQFRMHPALCVFPSKEFYQGKLKTFPGLERDRPAPQGFAWPDPEQPLCFIDVPESVESQTAEGSSYFNAMEGKVVLELLRYMLPDEPDVGVISPYRGQVTHLNQLLAESGMSPLEDNEEDQLDYDDDDEGSEEEDRLGSDSSLGPSGQSPQSGNKLVSKLEIKTVDGFQGREKQVIIFSAVRANSRNNVGFLSDYRRLNVAITRAKRGLLVVGHAPTLSQSPVWKDWLDHVKSRGLWVSAVDEDDELHES